MINGKRISSGCRGAVLVCCLLAGVVSANTEFTWRGGGPGGLWADPANWMTNGVQSAVAPTNWSDFAIFEIEGAETETVVFDDDYSTGRLLMRGGNIVFEMQGHTLTLLYPDQRIGATADGTGSLKVVNGELHALADPGLPNTNYYVYLPYAGGASWELEFSGEGARFYPTNRVNIGRAGSTGVLKFTDGAFGEFGSTLYVGNSAGDSGTIIVDNAKITSSLTILGRVAGSEGHMILTGPETDWTRRSAPDQRIGDAGIGSLLVTNGATASTGAWYFNIGRQATGVGTVTVVGEGSRIGAPYTSLGTLQSVSIGGEGSGKGAGTMQDPPTSGGIGYIEPFGWRRDAGLARGNTGLFLYRLG